MFKKILLFTCALMVTTTCYAYKDTIDGFRGIPLGASVEEVKNSGIVCEIIGPKDKLPDGSIIYETKFTEPNFLGVNLEWANLGFRDNKLTSISIFFEEDSKFSSYYKLFYNVKNQWGRPIEDQNWIDEKASTWRKNNTIIWIDSRYDALADEFCGLILILKTRR